MYSLKEQDENSGEKKLNIYLLILVFVITVDIVLLVVLLLYLSEAIPAGGIERKQVFNVTGTDKRMARLDAVQFCNSANKEMPHSYTQEDEEEVIEQIKNSPASTCSLVYYAHVGNDIRYASKTNKDIGWETIKYSSKVGDDPSKRLYYRLTMKNGKVITSETSDIIDDPSGISYKNLLLIARKKDDKKCIKHPFSCIYFYASKTKNTTAGIYNEAVKELKKQRMRVIAIVPYDPDHHPRGFNCVNCPKERTAALTVATRYTISYLYKGEHIEYNSKRFVMVDPEHYCLAYDLKKDELVTFDCDENACVACI